MSEPLTKRELCEQIYKQAVPAGYVWGQNSVTDRKFNQLLLTIFTTELGMTEAGARTYIIGCKRISTGLPFYHTIPTGPRDNTPHDNSPDVEDERPLYTVVYPADDIARNTCIVDRTHSFFDRGAAFAAALYGAIVVDFLPEIGSDFFQITPLKE